MSSHWSTETRDGSANGGSGGFGQQPAPVGGAAVSFNVENVNFDASISPRAAARRRAQRYNNLAVSTAATTTVVNTPGQQQQPQQHNGASAAARTASLVSGTGTRFNNSPQ